MLSTGADAGYTLSLRIYTNFHNELPINVGLVV